MHEQKVNQPNSFDTLRLFFAVLVVFSHSFPISRTTNDTEPLSVLTHGQITFGNISVWAFFAISGFLITQSWQRSPKIFKYLKRRIGRIYPGFAVATIVAAVFFIPMSTGAPIHLAVPLKELLPIIRSLRDLNYAPIFPNNPLHDALNGSLWSVSFEAKCYLGVILLGLTGMLRRRWMVIAVFFVVLAFRLDTDITGWQPGGGIFAKVLGFPLFWFAVLPFFLAGTIFQMYGGAALLRKPWLIGASIVLVASNFIPHGLVVTTPICGTYLLMGLAYAPFLHPLRLGRFGDFSYGTYLYAFPIQQLLTLRAHGHIAPLLLFAEAAPLAVGAGILSWFAVERNFLPRTSQLKHLGLAQVPSTPATTAENGGPDLGNDKPETESSSRAIPALHSLGYETFAPAEAIPHSRGESNAISKL